MNVRYENDLEKGAGFGLFHIDSVNIPAPSSLSFSIQRSSDGKYLGNAAWLDAEERLRPLTTTQADGTCTLHVAPEITKQLDALETYRFTFVGDGVQERAVLSIADTIIYGDVQQSGRIQGASAISPTTSIPPKPAPAEVLSPQEPIAAPVPPMPVAAAASAGASASRSIVAILAGLLSMGLIIGAVLMFMGILPNPFSGSSEIDQAASQQEPLVLSPMKQAAEFFTTKGSYEEAFALAKTMPSTEEGLDARFLLLELAAEGNILEAQMAVAQIYDPNHEAPTGTIMKDPEQALYWYEQVLTPQGNAILSPELRTQVEAAKAKLPIIQ